MSSSTANSMNGLDVMSINRIQDKKRRQAENSKRYRKTHGRLIIARAKERYATDPEYRERVLSRNRKPIKKDWITSGISTFRRALRKYNSPVSIFCWDKKFILIPENLGDHKEWKTWVIDGERIERTLDAMYEKYPDWFVGTYDTNIDTQELRRDISSFIARRHVKQIISSARGAGEHKQSYNLSAIPSLKITQGCPCDGCEYEKPCRELGLDCECYRHWMKGRTYKKFPKVPDRYHLDGSKLGPGVI